MARLAAQRQLTQHDDNAAAQRQRQIQDQEGEATIGTHFVGEAPYIAQPHSRAYSGHQKTEV